MIKKLFFALTLFPLCAMSQEGVQLWTGHYSYNNIKDISFGNGIIYASAENAFFRYNELNEITKVSTIEGLSGKNITASLYDEETNRFLLGHENGSMQVSLEDTQEIIQVVDIVEKGSISPDVKQINDLMKFGEFIYIATNFGISLYNLNTLEFDDTYFIGENGAQVEVRKTTIYQDNIYAATNDGIYRAPVMNDNLIDFDQWERIRAGNWIAVQAFAGVMYAIDRGRRIFSFDGAFSSALFTFPQIVNDVEATEEYITITTEEEVFVYDTGFNVVVRIDSFIDFPDVEFNAALLVGNDLYIGSTEFGMLKTSLSNPSTAEEIHPQGPLRNSIFGMEKTATLLWNVFGFYDIFYNPFPSASPNRTEFNFGISYLEDNTWTDISYEDAFSIRVMAGVTADPNDETHLYVNSFHDGLLELTDNVPSALFNGTNTPEIPDTDPGNPNNLDYRLGKGAFDNNGDFWFTASQSSVPFDLIVRRANGSFQGFDADAALPNVNFGYSNIVIDRNGSLFFGGNTVGLIGFNESNNAENQFRGITDENNLPSDDVRALAIDNRGQLWIGTARGLRVLFNTSDFFNPESTPEPQEIIILDNGEASELLFQQFITDIEVDGSNNKWIATSDSGVFYLSSNGQETIHHFTTDNSPLPSNTINDIVIDGITGEVFIATTSGLLSFNGSATDPSENLSEVYAFPNPVRPGGDKVTISGLTSRANVKITDIEGNLVFETTSEGGSVEWNLTAFGRHNVASGVYLVLVSSQDGQDSTIKKIMVVR